MLDSEKLIGRQKELNWILACLENQKNVMLEGPVGVGKTHLALIAARSLKIPVFRVDADERYTEQKLIGWFDPPKVIKHGYTKETFVEGPLFKAMNEGGILFINELNRLPEGVQNCLLPAIDEKTLGIPQLTQLVAKKQFCVIATQNPKEFIATSHLSEALLDRFECITMDYLSYEEELGIVKEKVKQNNPFVALSTQLIRLSRIDERVKRGASIRAAISIAQVANSLLNISQSKKEDAFLESAVLSMKNRIELQSEFKDQYEVILKDWVNKVLGLDESADPVKKKVSLK